MARCNEGSRRDRRLIELHVEEIELPPTRGGSMYFRFSIQSRRRALRELNLFCAFCNNTKNDVFFFFNKKPFAHFNQAKARIVLRGLACVCVCVNVNDCRVDLAQNRKLKLIKTTNSPLSTHSIQLNFIFWAKASTAVTSNIC